MSRKISVAVVDDHPLVREGVIHVFNSSADIEVVGQGTTAADAAEIVSTIEPDVLVLDLSIPGNGMSAIQAITAKGRRTRILVLTVSDDEADVFEALRRGVSGYVLKGVSGIELAQAVRTLHAGGQYLSPSLGARMLADLGRDRTEHGPAPASGVSSREDQIWSLVADGHSNRDIAEALGLSEKTVKYHLTNLFRKLKVKSRLELAVLLQKGGKSARAKPAGPGQTR
jgi:two-component system nitrate/nitrite response regulator NarL